MEQQNGMGYPVRVSLDSPMISDSDRALIMHASTVGLAYFSIVRQQDSLYLVAIGTKLLPFETPHRFWYTLDPDRKFLDRA